MISGIALLISSLLAMQSSPSETQGESVPAPDVVELIAHLKLPTPSTTPYVEARFSKMLKQPMQLRGELRYDGPGTLGKRVDAPYREATTVANGEVEVKRDGRGSRRFSLDRSPELSALIAGVSGILGGDAITLHRYFAITKAGEGASWRLVLKPRSSQLAKQLEDMVVDGGHDGIHCITTREKDGDSSVMRLGAFIKFPVSASAPAEELEKLCRPALLVH